MKCQKHRFVDRVGKSVMTNPVLSYVNRLSFGTAVIYDVNLNRLLTGSGEVNKPQATKAGGARGGLVSLHSIPGMETERQQRPLP